MEWSLYTKPECSQTGNMSPWPGFDWKRLQDDMIKRDVEFNVKSEEEYEVAVY